MAETILPKGIRLFNKHEKAPDFVIGSMVVTPDELNAFCIDNPQLMTEYNGAKQLRLQILRSKDGKLYCNVDTWKPGAKESLPAEPFEEPVILPTDDLPF